MSKFKRSCQKWATETDALNDVLAQNSTIVAADLTPEHNAQNYVWVTQNAPTDAENCYTVNAKLIDLKVATEDAMKHFNTSEANLRCQETDELFTFTKIK